MTRRRPSPSDLAAALQAMASVVGRSVLVLMLAAAPTLTALASVATDQPPRAQVGLPGQAEVLEEEIHVATLPTVPAVAAVPETPLLDGAVVVADTRRDAPPTPPPPER